MKFTTTIKQTALDMKKEDLSENGYFDEYKDDSEFWHKRIFHVWNNGKTFDEVVLLCGKEVSRFKNTKIEYVFRYMVELKYQPFLTTDKVWKLRCVVN